MDANTKMPLRNPGPQTAEIYHGIKTLRTSRKNEKKNCPCVIRLADEGNRFPLFRPQPIDTPVHLMSCQTNWAAEVNVVRTLAAFIPKQMLPSLEVLI